MWRGFDGAAEFGSPRDAERLNTGEIVAKNSEAELMWDLLSLPWRGGKFLGLDYSCGEVTGESPFMICPWPRTFWSY